MKNFKTTVISILICLLIVFSLSAADKKDRPEKKLSIGAYLSTVKIEVVSGDQERYAKAIQYLEDLFYWYGPHAEALYWRGQIEVDYISKETDLTKIKEYVNTFVAYSDSLHICCDKDNKEIKKKYKKKCDEYIEKTDSVSVLYWRQYYNNAINLMNDNVVPLLEDITNETDSATLELYKENLQANVDSSEANFEICLALDSAKIESYVGLGTLFDKTKDYENAIKWLVKGLDKTEDPTKLLQTIAYDYIKMGDYAGAIPYMHDYLELAPEDLLTMGNLAICYNSQKMFDSSFAVYKRILEADSVNIDALSSVGHYFRQQSQDARDSLNFYKEAENKALIAEWDKKNEAVIDSFLVYYKKVIEIDPQNEQIQFLYATYNYFRSNWDLAIKSFIAATEINPGEKDYWRSLGDCYIQTKEYDKSAAAYEKVIELDPTDKPIWEQLVSLYAELKRPADKANAEKQVKALE